MKKRWLKGGKIVLIAGVVCLTNNCPCDTIEGDMISLGKEVSGEGNLTGTVPIVPDLWYQYSGMTGSKIRVDVASLGEAVNVINDVYDNVAKKVVYETLLVYKTRTVEPNFMSRIEIYPYRAQIRNGESERTVKITVDGERYYYEEYEGTGAPPNVYEYYSLVPVETIVTLAPNQVFTVPGVPTGSTGVPALEYTGLDFMSIGEEINYTVTVEDI